MLILPEFRSVTVRQFSNYWLTGLNRRAELPVCNLKKESKDINTRYSSLLLCLCMVMTALAWWGSGAQEAISLRTPVTATTAISRNIEVWESSIGQLEARVEPLIAAEVAGQLGSVTVEVGQLIERGQLLAEINAEDFTLPRRWPWLT